MAAEVDRDWSAFDAAALHRHRLSEQAHEDARKRAGIVIASHSLVPNGEALQWLREDREFFLHRLEETERVIGEISGEVEPYAEEGRMRDGIRSARAGGERGHERGHIPKGL
jgi:prophage maintenance system killer protein